MITMKGKVPLEWNINLNCIALYQKKSQKKNPKRVSLGDVKRLEQMIYQAKTPKLRVSEETNGTAE